MNDGDLSSWESVSIFALTGCLGVLVLVYILLEGGKVNFLSIARKIKRRSLPGPWGLPFLGHLPLLGSMPHLSLTMWSKRYGNVFQIRLGQRKTIVVNGSKTIRQLLQHRGIDFAGRPQFPSFQIVNNGQGMIFNSFSPVWQVKRTVMQRAVGKYLSNGTEYLHRALKEHCDSMIDQLLHHSGQSHVIDPAMIVLRHSSRFFYNILISDFQENKEVRHQQVEKLIHLFHSIMKLSSYTAMTDIYPALQIFFPKQLSQFKEINDIIYTSLKDEQLASLRTFNSDVIRDITDGLVVAKDSISDDDLKNADLLDNDDNSKTLALLGDLLGAGQSTVSSTLKWLLLHMASFPEVRNKVIEEIRQNYTDETEFLDVKLIQKKFPYTVATIHESQRFGVLFPMLVPHATMNDTEIDGYQVEKDTIVIFNIWSASRDPEEWTDPETFKPERFLTDDGQELDKAKLYSFPAFGIGRRRCLGEQLGIKATYYFFLRIMKSCKIFLPDDSNKPSLSGVFGFSLDPEPYQLNIMPSE